MHRVPCKTRVRLAAVLALGVATAALATEPADEEPDLAPPASETADAEPVSNPAGGGGSSVIERLERPARTKRLVYACRTGAIPMFSDRPCGDEVHTRRLVLPAAPMSAGSAPSTQAATAPAATRPIAVPVPHRDVPLPVDRCARLEEAVAAIDARMRQGYSAREAARLWDRWRAAKAKLRDARC